MQSNWKCLFCIKIPAVPVGQPRARATVRKFGNKVSAGVYDVRTIKCADGTKKPHPIVAFKATIRHAVQARYSGPLIDGPVKLHIQAIFPRPKSMIWKKREMPRAMHLQKPDGDNVLKAVKDALNQLLWRDDCLVQTQTCEKWIAAGDEAPHVVLCVWTYEGERA